MERYQYSRKWPRQQYKFSMGIDISVQFGTIMIKIISITPVVFNGKSVSELHKYNTTVSVQPSPPPPHTHIHTQSKPIYIAASPGPPYFSISQDGENHDGRWTRLCIYNVLYLHVLYLWLMILWTIMSVVSSLPLSTILNMPRSFGFWKYTKQWMDAYIQWSFWTKKHVGDNINCPLYIERLSSFQRL